MITILDYFRHFGVKGMHWGHRKDTVFVSGSSKTQMRDSPYYRKQLPSPVRKELNKEMKRKSKIIVGDAPGIDRQVQDYLNKNKYKKVVVYGPDQIRYQSNKKWKSKAVKAPEFEKGSPEWLAKKDIAMSNKATSGLAVVLDEGSKATRRNVTRLIDRNKNVKVYELNKQGAEYDRWVM